jgi:dihydrofolate reductase
MRLSLIVAMSRNGIIGRDNDMPWHLPDDLQRFKALTMGHPIVMGRRTYESIGRPLPGRRNLVLSRNPRFSAPGVEVHRTLASALESVAVVDEVFVIGGSHLYVAALPMADRLYLTRIHADIEGDTRFPDLADSEWRRVDHEPHAADERHAHDFSFEIWDRVMPEPGRP